MPNNAHQSNHAQPDDQPQVFAVRRDLSGGWTFTRRGFVAAGVAAAGAALSGCGSGSESATPPTNTPDFATSRSHISPEIVAHPHVRTLLLTPDQTRLVSMGSSIYKLWAFPSGEFLKSMIGTGPSSYAFDVTILQDGSLMIGTMPPDKWKPNNKIGLYSLPDGDLINTIVPPVEVDTLVATPDNRLLISSDYGHGFQVWSLPDGNPIQTYQTPSDGGSPIAVSPDSTLVAAVYSDHNIALWSLQTGELVSVMRKDVQYEGIIDVKFSPDGKYLIEHCAPLDRSVSQDCYLRLWLIEEEKQLWEVTASGIAAVWFAFSPDSKILAAQDDSFGLKLWDTASGEVLGEFDQVAGPLTFSPDGSLLAAAYEKTVALRSGSTGALIRTLPYDGVDGVLALLFTADGSQLLVGHARGGIHRCSVPSGDLLAVLVDPEEVPQAIQFQTVQLENGELVPVECGSGLPAGAVCTCNCVAGSGCACVGDVADSGGSSGGGHYWYPN